MSNKKKYAKYVPQYKTLGIKPVVHDGVNSEVSKDFPKQKVNQNDNKKQQTFIRQDASQPKGDFKLPNVGYRNDSSQQNKANQSQEEANEDDGNSNFYSVEENLLPDNEEEEVHEEQDFQISIKKLKHNMQKSNYLLFVDDVPFGLGTREDIEKTCNMLIFGTHPSFLGKSIDRSRFFIIKKINTRFGISME